MNWRKISEYPDTRIRRVSLVYQSVDGSYQTIEGSVLFDPYLGGAFMRRDGTAYNLPENGEYATHWGEPFEVPDPDPAMESP